MKKLISTFACATSALFLSAQISQEPIKTFEYEGYDYPFYQIFTYENGNQVLVAGTEMGTEPLSIYDLSFNLIQSFPSSPLPENSNIGFLWNYNYNSTYSETIFVSERLFNNDNLLEYIITTNNAWIIINEDGEEIFKKTYEEPGDYSFELFETKNGKLLKVHQRYLVEIYALPGYTTPTGLRTTTIQSIGNPFPNPAKTYINLPYSLPEGTREATIRVFDAQGKMITTLRTNERSQFVRLETSNLPTGTYTYTLESRGQQIESKQFIVQ